jgi:soluble lytic murein transglycosylase-like protein
MADSIRVARRAGAEAILASNGLIRMTLVITTSISVLVAIPGWLRSLEESQDSSTQLFQTSPLELEPAPPPASPVASVPRDAVRQQALADFLAKRYRVSKEALERFIRLAYSAGQMTKIDPLLILAVISVESSFNPIAESVMGAKGLMQIIPEYHQDKLRTAQGAALNPLDPETNILAGAKVLREYATRTGEDLAAALRLYGGTGPDPENSYSNKVLSERERLEQIIRRAQERRAVQAAATAPRS